MLKMFVQIFLFTLYSVYSPISVAQFSDKDVEPNNNEGHCEIPDFPPEAWTTIMKLDKFGDNAILKDLTSWKYTGKLDIVSCVKVVDPDFSKYVKFTNESGVLKVSTTKELKEIDNDLPRQDPNTAESDVTCSFNCKDGVTRVKFDFTIEDINDYDPTFEKKDYSFSVPSPLMPEVDLSRYGEPIVVTDLDFSNRNVTFKIEPNDFDIQTSVNGKKYTAVFFNKEVIILTEPKTYTLTATDTGTNPGPRSSQSTIKLTVDSSKSVDTPTFTHSSYSFEYSEEKDGTPVLKPVGDSISVKSSKLKTAKITISGDQKDNIKATFNDKNEIELKLKSKIDLGETLLSFTITVQTDTTSSALVIVQMPKPIIEFNKQTYSGKYDPTKKTVTVDEITIKSSATPTLTLSGDESTYLDVKFDETKKSWSITVKDQTGIPEKELEGKTFLTVTITATIGKTTKTIEKAVVVISLPSISSLKFTQSLYEASYDAEKKTVTVERKHPIAFNGGVSGISIGVDSKYSKYFEIKYNEVTKNYDVIVSTELPSDILLGGRSLVVEISALDADKHEAKAILEIVLPKITGPEFSKTHYEVNYPKNGKDVIDVALDFVAGFDLDKISVTLGDYNGNFTISPSADHKKWQITITHSLSTNFLRNNKEILIPLSATQIGETSPVSHSVLIMTLPVVEEPEFAETIYEAVYPEDGKGDILFKPELKFKGSQAKTIQLSQYSDNFKIIEDKNIWKIKINNPLDLNKFKDETALAVIITAKDADGFEGGTATLVIKLPSSKAVGPTFKDVYYNLVYPKDAKDGLSIDFSALSFNGVTDESKVAVSIATTNYKTNFKVTRDPTTKKWHLVVSKALDPKVLKDNSQLLITLTVEEAGKSTKGSTLLILKLEKDTTKEALKFENEYYVTKYPKTGKGPVEFDNDIKFSNLKTMDSVKIVPKDYTGNFTVTYDTGSKKWHLNIVHPLSQETLKNHNALAVLLEATAVGYTAGSATLVIEIEKETSNEPKFKEPLYTADYPESGKGNITLSNLDFENVKNKESVKIVIDGYEKNFNCMLDATKTNWIIVITNPLDKIDGKTDLPLTMTATTGSSTFKGALVLHLHTETIPKFKDDYYTVVYPKTASVGSELEINEAIAFSNYPDDSKVEIAIEDQYKDNFEITRGTNKKWVVKIIKILDKDTIEKSKQIFTHILAHKTGETSTGKVVLVIQLPTTDTVDHGLEFSHSLYTGEYKKTDTSYEVLLNENIVVKSKTDTDKITLSLQADKDFDANKYFTIEKGSIKVKTPLDDKILQVKKYLTITIQAKLEGETKEATLVVNLPTDSDKRLIDFENVLYTGKYEKKKLTLDGIKLITDLPDEEVDVVFLTDTKNFAKEFKITRKDKVVTIEVQGTLPTESTVISLVLEAIVKKTVQASAVIEIEVIGEKKETIKFEKLIYTGEYNVQKETLDISEAISLETDLADDKIGISITDDLGLASHLKPEYKNKKLTITKKDAFPKDKIENKKFVSFTITALADGTSVSSVLNIKIGDVTKTSVKFDRTVYNGKLSFENDKGHFSIDSIMLSVTPATDNVEVSVSKEYQSYFTAELKDGKVNIALLNSANINNLKNFTNIAVELTADIKGQSISAFAVLNIEIVGDKDQTDHIVIPKVLYSGTYSIKDGHPHVELDDSIIVITNEQDQNLQSQLTGDGSEYFQTSLDKKQVKIEPKGTIPSDFISKHPVVALTLDVNATDANYVASAVVSIKLGGKKEDVKFDKLIYTGEYNVQKETLDISESISLETDLADDKIGISITDDLGLATHLKPEYKNKKLTITKKDAFPKDKIKNEKFVSFTITALADGASVSSVLNIKIEVSDDTKTSIKFDRAVYNGKLSFENDKGNFNIDPIVLSVTPATDNVEVSVSKEYQSYFKAELKEGKVSISLLSTANINTLKNFTNIAVELTADIKGQLMSTFAVLNIEIFGDKDQSDNIVFPQILYSGIYSIKDGKPNLGLDQNITVITNEPEKNLQIELKGEGSEYFKAIVDKKEIMLEPKSTIPVDFVEKYPVVTLTLDVKATDTSYMASAIVSIKLDVPVPSPTPDDGSDKTPYIIAISLLSVCIVVIIIAAIAFYYYKLRTKDYTEVDEEIWKVRFDKTSTRSSGTRKGSALDGRRPTGFVFNSPPPEEEPKEIDENEKSEPADRRKSVLFDNRIDKREIDSVLEDDDDKDKKDN